MNGTPITDHPVARQTTRDDIGRIVALAIDSAPAPAHATAPTWLVAIDGSAHATRALAACLEICRQAQVPPTVHLAIVEPWMSK
jgi:hypothetical protein